MVKEFFQNIFTTSQTSHPISRSFVSPSVLNHSEISSLKSRVTLEEVKEALMQMDPLKCPGPDGIQPLFYQRNWNHMGRVTFDFINSCFMGGKFLMILTTPFSPLSPRRIRWKNLLAFDP